MLGKLWTIGAVAAILMMPTALSAQVGGAINPGVHVGGAVNAGGAVRGAVSSPSCLCYELIRTRKDKEPQEQEEPRALAARRVFIPSPIDQNRCAHWRNPRDMMRHG